jgi:hypothetical protein
MSGPPNGSDRAASPSTDSANGGALDAAAWAKEFEQLVAEVKAAAEEWGVEPDSVEGRFVSALLGTTRWLGGICVAAQANVENVVRQSHEAAERELAQAREIRRAAEVSLRQARTALISLEVEQENLTVKMIKETLPLFAERLKDALVYPGAPLERRRQASPFRDRGSGGARISLWRLRGACVAGLGCNKRFRMVPLEPTAG